MGIARCSMPIAGGSGDRCGLVPGHAGGHESSGLLQSRSGRDVAPGCPRCPHDAFGNQAVTDTCTFETYPVRDFPEPLPGELGYNLASVAPAHGYEPPPNHYNGGNGLDVWTIWQAYELDAWEGALVKYILRSGKKAGESRLKDYRKALNYLQYLIEREEKNDG